VPPDAVVKDYQAARATLEVARFKVKCCLRGLRLDGQLVPPDVVVKDLQAARAILEIGRFKEECCLRGLVLNGRPVTPDAVVKDYQAVKATLEMARFKGQCCLRGLRLDGQQVTPDAVVKDYERGGRLFERAIFYAQLALNARELNGNYLDNQKVLAAFNEVPGDHSSRQAEFLMQRLKQSQRYGETSEAQDRLQDIWQILNGCSVKDDEQHRLQCILQFMAMDNELTIDHQRVSAEQVLQSIKTLRRSFKNSRLHFFFLAHCYITRQSINGREIHKDYVLGYLESFPEGSRLRHALGCWFEQYSCEASSMDNLLFNVVAPGGDSPHGYAASASQHRASVATEPRHKPRHKQSADNAWWGCLLNDGNRYSGHRVNNPGHGHRYHLPDLIPNIESAGGSAKSVEVSIAYPGREGPYQVEEYRDETENTPPARAVTLSPARTLQQWSTTGGPGIPEKPVPRLNALTLKALGIIQEVNDSYTDPPILITGSYARFLQKLCSFFNDIDIICTTEESARTLFDKLQALNTHRDSDIPTHITILPIRGCHEIKLPKAYNIYLQDGDLGTKAMELQVSVDDRVTYENAAQLAFHVPGVQGLVRCLSFAEETRLLNDTLEYLADNLDLLTEQLKTGAVLHIPRTILFNFPQNPDEGIYGLLMRCLLTLNKAGQFIALHSDLNTGKTDYPTNPLQEQHQRLHALTEKIRMKLHSHVCRHDFELRVNNWLSTTSHVNDYEIMRKEFIETLLAMMHPE
ncbi:hypothetical protein, partial [Endozoicomonas sp. YOMI1]|uniref:hypothetical protein n=1 Tax=Endozoicomonas sp. YOMI1 TaxID=2828739 RepID=UPI0021475131